jgi:hypothetical protein
MKIQMKFGNFMKKGKGDIWMDFWRYHRNIEKSCCITSNSGSHWGLTSILWSINQCGHDGSKSTLFINPKKIGWVCVVVYVYVVLYVVLEVAVLLLTTVFIFPLLLMPLGYR